MENLVIKVQQKKELEDRSEEMSQNTLYRDEI